MKASRKADYGLRAMLELSLSAGARGSMRSGEIAKAAGVPEKFLEAILVDLRRAGLVESRRGPDGGFRLARPPARISAGEVWRAVDGPFTLVERLSGRAAGRDPRATSLREMWQEVESAVATVVDGRSLEDLARRAREGREVQDFTI